MPYFPPDSGEHCAPVITRKVKAAGQVEARLAQWWFDHAPGELSDLQATDVDVNRVVTW